MAPFLKRFGYVAVIFFIILLLLLYPSDQRDNERLTNPPPHDTSPCKLIIYIVSAPYEAAERQQLRRASWLSHGWRNRTGGRVTGWRYRFVSGLPEDQFQRGALISENEHHGDIVFSDPPESYQNLVLKTIWTLRHFLENNNDCKYILKTDTDTFINIGLMLEYLGTLPDDGYFYGGYGMGGTSVHRGGQWGIPRDTWAPDTLPPYASGGGYILSRSTTARLVQVLDSRIQPVFYVEDAFVGSLVFHAGLTRTVVPGFTWHHVWNGCVRAAHTSLVINVKSAWQEPFIRSWRDGRDLCWWRDPLVVEHLYCTLVILGVCGVVAALGLFLRRSVRGNRNSSTDRYRTLPTKGENIGYDRVPCHEERCYSSPSENITHRINL